MLSLSLYQTLLLMTRIILTMVGIILTSNVLLAQHVHSDEIVLKKNFWSWKFYQNDVKLSSSKVAAVLKESPIAHKKFASYRTLNTLSSIVGSIGGGLVGFGLGSGSGSSTGNSNTDNSGLYIAGAALIGTSIPLSIIANGNGTKAIKLYNEGLKKPVVKRTQLSLGFAARGFTIRYIF